MMNMGINNDMNMRKQALEVFLAAFIVVLDPHSPDPQIKIIGGREMISVKFINSFIN